MQHVRSTNRQCEQLTAYCRCLSVNALLDPAQNAVYLPPQVVQIVENHQNISNGQAPAYFPPTERVLSILL